MLGLRYSKDHIVFRSHFLPPKDDWPLSSTWQVWLPMRSALQATSSWAMGSNAEVGIEAHQASQWVALQGLMFKLREHPAGGDHVGSYQQIGRTPLIWRRSMLTTSSWPVKARCGSVLRPSWHQRPRHPWGPGQLALSRCGSYGPRSQQAG